MIRAYVTDRSGIPYRDAAGCACLELPDSVMHYAEFRQIHNRRAADAARLLRVHAAKGSISLGGHVLMAYGPGADSVGYALRLAAICERFPRGTVELYRAAT